MCTKSRGTNRASLDIDPMRRDETCRTSVLGHGAWAYLEHTSETQRILSPVAHGLASLHVTSFLHADVFCPTRPVVLRGELCQVHPVVGPFRGILGACP